MAIEMADLPITSGDFPLFFGTVYQAGYISSRHFAVSQPQHMQHVDIDAASNLMQLFTRDSTGEKLKNNNLDHKLAGLKLG